MIIYSRFNSRRRRRFQLRTSVELRGDTLVVSKHAMQPEAVPFLQEILLAYSKLSELKLPFEINKPYRSEKNQISFDYIDADSLESLLIGCLRRKQKDSFLNMIAHYCEQVRSFPQVPQQSDRHFKSVFGDHPASECDCLSIGCLDINFDNILAKDDGFVLIDYEWTFPFPIPADFIIFRAILGFYGNNKRLRPNSLVPLEEALRHAAIAPENFESFLRMENRFQQYVYDDIPSTDTNGTSALSELGKDPPTEGPASRLVAMNAYLLFLEKENALKQSWIMKLEDSIRAKDSWTSKLEQDNSNLRHSTEELSKQLTEIKAGQAALSPTKVYDSQLQPVKDRLATLESELQRKDELIEDLEKTVLSKSEWISKLQEEVLSFTSSLQELRQQMEELTKR
ncbi:MAG: hypothetical protein J5J00_00625 [Deltaproteobacteria bacterium]|nr:hypothetical protein [Deltaproteobacteria bacterium]